MLPKLEEILPNLIALKSVNSPNSPFLKSAFADEWLTYGQAQAEIVSWAVLYRGNGVTAGHTVATMLEASPVAVCSWIGAASIQAIEVPINTGYVGRILAHVINDSGAELMAVDGEHIDQIVEVLGELRHLKKVIVIGDSPLPTGASVDFVPLESEWPSPSACDEFRPESITPYDTACILYTSGTTGPPKGVQIPWAQLYATATGLPPFPKLGPSDRYYSPYPMFHVGGKHPPYVMALAGGALVLRDRFSSDNYWSDIDKDQCTVTFLLSAMTQFVQSRPLSESRGNPMRHVMMVPLLEDTEGFENSYGVELSTIFNMTEVSCPIVSPQSGLVNNTSCGRQRPGYEVRIVDDHDIEVADGEIGELVVRASDPWVHMSGYWGAPERTVEAWRNQWFHTGDAFTRDSGGNYYFRERMNDVIRRRGENISGSEIEAEAMRIDGVSAAAAVGVPSEFGEAEIKLVLLRQEGSDLDLRMVHQHLKTALPKFMVPRYLEFVDEFPLTPTQKIKKSVLREAGITSGTVDSQSGALT